MCPHVQLSPLGLSHIPQPKRRALGPSRQIASRLGGSSDCLGLRESEKRQKESQTVLTLWCPQPCPNAQDGPVISNAAALTYQAPPGHAGVESASLGPPVSAPPPPLAPPQTVPPACPLRPSNPREWGLQMSRLPVNGGGLIRLPWKRPQIWRRSHCTPGVEDVPERSRPRSRRGKGKRANHQAAVLTGVPQLDAGAGRVWRRGAGPRRIPPMPRPPPRPARPADPGSSPQSQSLQTSSLSG